MRTNDCSVASASGPSLPLKPSLTRMVMSREVAGRVLLDEQVVRDYARENPEAVKLALR